MFSQGNVFAPKIDKVDYREDGFSVYSMPLYPKVTAPKKQLNVKAYAIYTTLRSIYGDYYEFVKKVETSNLDEDVKESIIELCSDACNGIDPQDMGFEISPRNITTDDNGNLIMLDCFFSRKLLRTTRSK
jgi:methyl coenzyme M reductase alpha subunit